MILLALTMLAIGSADIVDSSTHGGLTLALLGPGVLTFLLGRGLGLSWLEVAVAVTALSLIVSAWLSVARYKPGTQLWLLAVVLFASFAASSAIGADRSTLGDWYSNLPFGFVHETSIEQFVLAASTGVFATVTSNRIVKLILGAVGTHVQPGESRLKGGRILGPMERIFVGAMIVSGSLAGVGALIAAKGFLRLPEMRRPEDQQAGIGDDVTEYFLIGTFSSLLIAGALGLLLLASS